jgi:L-ascorbate metabolism protein UlaG (beta-lactamase superfamily)
MSIRTIKNFPYKNTKVLVPLKLGKYFTKNGYKKSTVKEMDWFDKIKINDEITVTMLPSQHWSKRWIWGDGNTNRSLWGSFLIEYKGKKIFFACDTGPAPFYKELGKKFGPIDLGFGNLGAYNFYPIIPVKDKSTAHANPEELLSLMKDLKVKKVIGMHWGTAILSLEPIWEPPVRFKENAEKFGYKKEEAIIFKIGEIKKLNDLIN